MAAAEEIKYSPVRLFPNKGNGYGFAVTGAGAQDLPEGYERTINFTCRDGNLLVPSFRAVRYGYGADLSKSFLIAWQDATNVPFALTASTSVALKFQDNALAAETDATTAFYGGACYGDDGAAAASRVGLILAGTTTGSTLLNTRVQAGTWTEDADVVAMKIVNTGQHYWATINNFQAKNCPIGSDPRTIGNWSAAYNVCSASLVINSIGFVEGKVLFGVDDGIYSYDSGANLIRNIYPVPYSRDNFPFFCPDGMGGTYTATAFGQIVHALQFGGIETIDPLRDKPIGRDTPQGRFVDMAVHGRDVYALLDCGQKRTQNLGVRTLKTADNFSTFTAFITGTDHAVDQSMATVVDLSSLDTLANGDAFLLGADFPFIGFYLRMVAANSSATATMSVSYSTGVGTWSNAVSVYDGTATMQDSITLGLSGLVLLKQDDSDWVVNSWVKATYNNISKYWLRITFSTACDASTTIGEIEVIPHRAGPPFTRTSVGDVDDWEAAGMFPKVIRGRYHGDTLVWDDIYTSTRAAPALHILASPLPTPTTPAGSLLVTTKADFIRIPLTTADDPAVANYPQLATDTVPSAYATFHPSAWDGGGLTYEVGAIDVVCQDVVENTDEIHVSFRWNETNAWVDEQVQSSNFCHFTWPLDSNYGEVLHVAVGLKDGASTEPVAPAIREITAWVRERPRPDVGQPARTTPEVS